MEMKDDRPETRIGTGGLITRYCFYYKKLDARFLIGKQKMLSKNQLTVPFYKLCTQLSTKIVDSFLQRDGRSQRLSRRVLLLIS
jgi:hypothetical protein